LLVAAALPVGDDVLTPAELLGVFSRVLNAEGADVLVIHGAGGSTGIVHAGRIRTSSGIARCPMTAAVHRACREDAERLRSR
jgi:isopentenyl phosphate kinase